MDHQRQGSMILHRVPISPYHIELLVAISSDPESDISKININNKGLDARWPKDCAACTHDVVWNGIIFVFFDKSQFAPEIVAHEVVHVVNIAYDFLGINHDAKNDEHQAYLTGWLVGEIIRISKIKKKK
jgi:hypothetical protein